MGSEAREEQLREQGYPSRINRKSSSRRAWNWQEQPANHQRSKLRARVEYVVGDQHTRQSNVLVRAEGKIRATDTIGLRNLTCSMRRLEFLLGGTAIRLLPGLSGRRGGGKRRVRQDGLTRPRRRLSARRDSAVIAMITPMAESEPAL